MNNLSITDIGTWISDNKDKIYRVLIYKKMFTPLEVEKKYIDESEFTENSYTLVHIVEGIEVPNDVLLKMLIANTEEENKYIYKKLSDIQIEEFDFDN